MGVFSTVGGIMSTVGISWVPWGMFSTVGDIMINVKGYLEYCGGYLEYRGRISWCTWGYHEYRGGVQYHGGKIFFIWVPHGTEHPHGTQDNPHGTHDIPHGTEHPTVLKISPHLSWYPPWYWTPSQYSRYPPTILMISITVLSTPTVLHTHYKG